MKKLVFMGVLVLGMQLSVCAQWVCQQVDLVPGWNAVYLTVAPSPSDCDSLLASYPAVESVWRWNKRFSPIDFDVDPSEPFRDEDAWLRWYPADHPYRSLRNLQTFQGGVAHLIRVASNAAPFTLVVTGTPLLPSADWFEFQINLMGMPVDADNPSTFNDYFADVPEIGVLPDVDLGEIYKVNAQAGGDQVMQPARTLIERGKAYWILCGDKTDYAGPVKATLSPNSNGVLDFGGDGVEGTLSFVNVLTNQAITLRVTLQDSAQPPSGETPDAGVVPLGYWGAEGTNAASWIQWTGALEETVGAGQVWSVPVCVWRSAIMTNAAGVYQCVLDIKESQGRVHFQIPVRAEVKAVE